LKFTLAQHLRDFAKLEKFRNALNPSSYHHHCASTGRAAVAATAMANEVLAEGTRGKRARYYLQNFHFQSGGWMTDDSASRYNTQVEVLFNGTANGATRRQALPQLHEIFAGRDQRKLRLLDIGCGTGRFRLRSGTGKLVLGARPHFLTISSLRCLR
jgi:2-polyprenyl-3-methyl-5-hydroxy-6-metoxy-1,4-benzoquinol methylase